MTFYKWSKTASSNASADSAVNWAEGMAPSGVNDSGRGMMASAAKGRDDIAGSLTTGGTSTAYTLTSNQVFDSLANMSGHMITFKVHTANGASPTLNVDSLGAKAIHSVGGTAVPEGALIENGVYAATYDNGNSRWVLHVAPGIFSAISTGGDVSVGGTLGVTGVATFSAAVTVSSGGLTVTAGGLTVSAGGAAITGNSTVTGTLGVTGNVAVNTDKFTVAAASGNTAVAGTLAVTGAQTNTGALVANNSAGITARNTVKAFGTVVSGSLQSGSFNVSGIADGGVFHTVSFTNAMASTDYTVLVSTENTAGGIIVTHSNRATGSFRVNGVNPGVSTVDPGSYSFMVLSNE